MGKTTAAPPPASTVRFTDAQFAQLLRALTERAAPKPPLADLVAAVDPVAGSVLRKTAAGTPLHELTREENEVVRRAWIREQHAGVFDRGARR